MATLGVAIAEGLDLLTAARLANAAAGVKCGKRGTTPVTRQEIGWTSAVTLEL